MVIYDTGVKIIYDTGVMVISDTGVMVISDTGSIKMAPKVTIYKAMSKLLLYSGYYLVLSSCVCFVTCSTVLYMLLNAVDAKGFSTRRATLGQCSLYSCRCHYHDMVY